MVKYLFVIFYLCVVMFLNLWHQLQKARHVVMVVAGMRDISIVHQIPVYTNYRCILYPPNNCRVRYYHSEFSTQHCLQYIFLSSSKKKTQKCRF